jgi:C-lobe and N-lobe beta barrels of Tf-binding protein B
MLTAGGWYCYGLLCGGDLTVNMPNPAGINLDPGVIALDWTTYGIWESWTEPVQHFAAFATGYQTPPGSVPVAGTATYSGSVQGRMIAPETGSANGIGVWWLRGDASLQANFASRNISGNLTMKIGDTPWNSVALTGTIPAGANSFSGTTRVTSVPAGGASLATSATGTFSGRFFGPVAQELGAVWTLHDGTATAIGSFGAKSGP